MASDSGGQLPGQVDRIEQPGVKSLASGREKMGRIACQQNSPVSISLGVSSLETKARQPNRVS